MKNLDAYIEKHGNHFTVELVNDIMPIRFNSTYIISTSQKKVWYNVTGSTFGDMMYLTNVYYHRGHSKGRCIMLMLENVGDYFRGGKAFSAWIASGENDFDFTPYI